MTTEQQLGHDEVLDLVADSLDFPLEEERRAQLEEHLAGCTSCSRIAERMAKDDKLFETEINWGDEGYGGEDDEDFDDEPDDDAESSGQRDEGGDEPTESDEDEDDDDEQDESDFEDATPLGSTEKGTNRNVPDEEEEIEDLADDLAAQSSAKEMDDEDGDDLSFDPTDGEGDISVDGAGETSFKDDTDDLDTDDPDVMEDLLEQAVQDEIDRLARGEADAASDEELAGEEDADDVTSTLDKLFPDCVADGVNELDDSKLTRAMAEKALREQEEIEKTDYGSVAVYRSTKGLLHTVKQSGYGYGYVEPVASGHAAAAIRNAILRSRTGTSAIERYQKRGKLDGKSLVKVSMGDSRLFKRNIAPDPGKYLIRVTVDVSGSMSGQPIADAAAVARALADASLGTPSVRLEVWAWSNPFAKDHSTYTRKGGYNYDAPNAGIVKVWGRQQPTSSVFEMTRLQMGGTPDAAILEWSWRNILKDTRSGEQPVILMCSDGYGDYRLPDVITAARKHGVDVKSVALGRYLTEDEQIERYGRGNYVPWAGSIEATARPLADMILRMVTGR